MIGEVTVVAVVVTGVDMVETEGSVVEQGVWVVAEVVLLHEDLNTDVWYLVS
jgi:hypothetical protein